MLTRVLLLVCSLASSTREPTNLCPQKLPLAPACHQVLHALAHPPAAPSGTSSAASEMHVPWTQAPPVTAGLPLPPPLWLSSLGLLLLVYDLAPETTGYGSVGAAAAVTMS
jgi:hypothetical protein